MVVDLISLLSLLDLIITGLMMGLLLSLMGLGLTHIYGIMRIINFAHGEFYMIGGYALYYASSLLGIPAVPALLFAALAGFFISLFVERSLIRDTYVKKMERPDEYALIVTFALSIFFQNMARELFGPFVRTPRPFWPGRVEFLGSAITLDRIVACIISVCAIALFYIFIKKTWTGRIWQAVAQNRAGAIALGVNIEKTNALAFAASGMLAALAGALLAPVFSVYSSVGTVPQAKGFVIIVLGGMGSIGGSLVGGLIVGLIDAMISVLISPAYATTATYILLIIFLLFRPEGLFGEKARRF